MAETLTLFEHELRPFALKERQRVLLDQLQQRMPEQVLQPVYRAGHWALRAGQHVGVVRLGAQTIQILPKIYQSPDTVPPARRAREATANLRHMLAYAGLVRVQESDVADLLSRESDWFEVLTYLFANHLRDEWRRGPARDYVAIEDELSLLKGKWRLSTQFRRPDRAHRFAVVYDEFPVDIPLNRIFHFVIERLHRVSFPQPCGACNLPRHSLAQSYTLVAVGSQNELNWPRRVTPPNKGIKLTKLSAAPMLARQAFCHEGAASWPHWPGWTREAHRR